jgi:hypothetical protein
MIHARQKNPEPSSAFAGRPEVQAPCTKMSFGDALSCSSRKTLVEKNLYAVFLSKRELEQFGFVAILPKNGLHRSSRRFARTLGRRASGRAVQ